ncbi:hypothetical protein OAI46_00125 [Alphaproteobacteria bacterium]|nr:hypothetical protein [Alphaproteobacteria bacterium]MDC0147263.1 hypothetical protein [Alphaproteobacteria bacterium]
MFIGHFAAGIALKGADKKIPLWALLIAVQLVDIATMIFVLLGWEKLDIVPGFTKTNDFDMFMPITHSLIMTPVWAAIGAGLYKLYDRHADKTALLIIAAAVACHWFLDLLVHVPDLPILFSEDWKFGFGLWNMPLLVIAIETFMLTFSLLIYRSTLKAGVAVNKYVFSGLCVVFYFFALHTLFVTLPVNNSQEAATTALIVFLAIPLLAWWGEKPSR